MVLTHGFSPIAWAELEHPKQKLRILFQFCGWIFARWRFRMISALAAILLFLQLPPMPGIGELFDRGVTFAFAILFWYSLTSSNKEHREDIRKLQDNHGAVIERLYDDAKRREERLVGVVEKNAEHIARLAEVVDKISHERWCPLQAEAGRR